MCKERMSQGVWVVISKRGHWGTWDPALWEVAETDFSSSGRFMDLGAALAVRQEQRLSQIPGRRGNATQPSPCLCGGGAVGHRRQMDSSVYTERRLLLRGRPVARDAPSFFSLWRLCSCYELFFRLPKRRMRRVPNAVPGTQQVLKKSAFK